ncbi:MAG: hypothetical protein WAZ12_00280 [Candidatus Absconditicoccaceae bacterium]
MEKYIADNFDVVKFDGKINISKDIFNSFSLPSNLIFWKQNNKEMVLFSPEKWNLFTTEMKKSSGFTQSQLEWTKEGKDFLRLLYSGGINVHLNKSGEIVFPKGSYLKRKLDGIDFNVKLSI